MLPRARGRDRFTRWPHTIPAANSRLSGRPSPGPSPDLHPRWRPVANTSHDHDASHDAITVAPESGQPGPVPGGGPPGALLAGAFRGPGDGGRPTHGWRVCRRRPPASFWWSSLSFIGGLGCPGPSTLKDYVSSPAIPGDCGLRGRDFCPLPRCQREITWRAAHPNCSSGTAGYKTSAADRENQSA